MAAHLCSKVIIGPPTFSLWHAAPHPTPHLTLATNSLPPAHEALSALAGHLAVANLVPESFPRLFDTLRSQDPNSLPRLPGFNVNDSVRLFFPDLMNPSNAYTFLLLLSCSVAFFYWEGGALLQDLRQERELERLEDEYLKEKEGKGSEADKNEGAVSAEEKASRERKRALGWLAMVTWLALWCTGAVNKLNPFMP